MMTNEEKLAQLNLWNKNTLMETLEIVFTDLGDDYLVGTMPVNSRVHQPLGLLHGGANIAFAESLGSCLSNILVAQEGKAAVGTNINSNHLKSKTSCYRDWETDRKSTRLNSSHITRSRMPSSA